MTIELLDPNDTGEIPPVGEHRMRIDTGEKTQRIDPRLIKAPSFDAIPRKVIEIDDTVTFRIPETIGVIPDPETVTLTVLGSLTAAPNGDLRPAAPGPRPGPLPPTPPPAPKPSGLRRSVPYVLPTHRAPWSGPRHRKPAPLWTRLVIAVGTGMALGAVLGLAVVAVIR